MSRPDVALVAPYPPRGAKHAGTSGVASYAANLATSLVDAGATVAVVAPKINVRESAAVPPSDEPIPTVHRAFGNRPWSLLAAWRSARETGAPIIHLQHELFLYGGAAALPSLVTALSARRRGRPAVVVTMHQVVSPQDVTAEYTRMHRVAVPAAVARGGLAGLQRVVSGLADAVVVHERAFTDVVPSAVLIPHGIEDLVTPDRGASRLALGLDGRLTVLCFGFVAPYKGLELACEAAVLAGGTVQLVVAGGDHPRMTGTHSYADALRERFADKVRFVGYVPEEQVGHWFGAADLALLPYPKPHASSGVLALAFGYGTPVLLSRALADCVGAPPLMTIPGTPAELAERLRELARDHARLDRIRAANAFLADGRSWPTVAGRHLDLYEEVTGGKGAVGRRVRTA
ncbi:MULTISPECIES: glycosyltransferase [unclassified Frankia]|uniref:glycosyltransferase n=1 Tax=unclassified Frankia TaxID=2632575 RepID=UPI001EF65310|nr:MULTISPECIES: glycosyltransferase [unclassified Frankia]